MTWCSALGGLGLYLVKVRRLSLVSDNSVFLIDRTHIRIRFPRETTFSGQQCFVGKGIWQNKSTTCRENDASELEEARMRARPPKWPVSSFHVFICS